MSNEITRFVLQGPIDDETAYALYELAQERGLKAASFILPLAIETSPESIGEAAVATEIVDNSEEELVDKIKAEKYQLLEYAKSIGYSTTHASFIWNRMVDSAYKNPVNHHYQFETIPTAIEQRYSYNEQTIREYTVTKPDDAQGLNVKRLFEWVQNMQSELAMREQRMPKTSFESYVSVHTGGWSTFKLLANFAYVQMGQVGPYDPNTFSTMSRNEKKQKIETEAERLLQGNEVNTDNPVVENVEVFQYGNAVTITMLGISIASMTNILEAHKDQLNLKDVSRAIAGTFVDNGSTIDVKTESGEPACTIDDLILRLANKHSSIRNKEHLCIILNEVLRPTPRNTEE